MNVSGGVLKFLALLLAFVIGFLACAGSLFFGGWYIYKNVSYETLHSWGLPLPSVDQLLDSHADVRLTSLTLAELVAEIQRLSGYGDRLTMELLVDRYGVKLPAELQALLPPALMEISLSSLFSPDGVDYLLSNTTAEYLFQFISEDALRAPARDALIDTKLSDMMGADLGVLLADCDVGYFMDVTYEKQEDGSYVLVYADPEHPTTNELIAPLSLGALLAASANGGDVLKVVKDDIGDVALSALLGDITDDSLDPFVKEKTLGEMILYDSASGKHVFSSEKLTADVYLGDIMGYEPVKDDPEDPERITAWLQNGEEVTALEGAMADVMLDEFMSSGFEMEEAVGHLYLGEVMGYEKEVVQSREVDAEPAVTYIWYEKELDENGERVPLKGVNKAVASVLLGDVLRGKESAVTGVLSDMYLGELMKYEQGEPITNEDGTTSYVWYEKKLDENGERVPLTGIDKAVANIFLDDLLNNEDFEISDAFSDLYLGELMKYEQGEPITNEDGTTSYVWYEQKLDENGERVPLMGIDKAVANIFLDDLLNNEDFEISDAFSDLYLGEVMGYEQGDLIAEATEDAAAEYAWTEDGVKVSGIQQKLSNYLLGDIIDGTTKVSVDDMYLYEVMDLYKKEYPAYAEDETTCLTTYTVWYEDEACTTRAANVFGALANVTMADMNKELPRMMIGATVGMLAHDGAWYNVSEVKERADGEAVEAYVVLMPAEGIMTAFADLSIDDMSDDEKVRGAVNTITMAEALGYTLGENELYYEQKVTDTTRYDYKEGAYYDKGTDELVKPITGVLATLVGAQIGEMQHKVENTYVGEIMGWKLVWVDKDDHTKGFTWRNGDAPARGLALPFASLTLAQMSDDEKVVETVENIHVYEVMGYIKGRNGLYYHKEHDITDETKYKYREAEGEAKGEYYDRETEDRVAPVDGIMAALAETMISELDDRVHSLTVSDVFSEEERSGGFLSLLAADTPLYAADGRSGLADTVTNVFQNETVGTFLSKGLISLGADTENTLNGYDRYKGEAEGHWKTLTINELLEYIASSLPGT